MLIWGFALCLICLAGDPQVGDRPPLRRGRGLRDAQVARPRGAQVDGGELAGARPAGRWLPALSVAAGLERVATRVVAAVRAGVEHDAPDRALAPEVDR